MKKVVRVAAWPVRIIALGVRKLVPHRGHATTMVVSVTVIMTGSFLASVPQTYVPHFLWDAFAYFLHGLGAAPIIDKLWHKDEKEAEEVEERIRKELEARKSNNES